MAQPAGAVPVGEEPGPGADRGPAPAGDPAAGGTPAAGEPGAGGDGTSGDGTSGGGLGAAGGAGDEAAPSGLRNPAAAVRGVGAGGLALEALVLLLAIVPLTKVGGHLTGAAIGSVLGLVALCVLLAGLLRHRWAWQAATLLQVALLACGAFHLALAALGVLFCAVWAYVLSVRHTVTGRWL